MPTELPKMLRIMPENITPLWPQIEALLIPALALASTHTPEDVRRSLMVMETQLWAQLDGHTVEAVATTEFARYPAGLFIRVWSAGARRDRKLDHQALYNAVDQWRAAHGAIGIEAIGRHGWLRSFPQAKVEGLIMRIIA